MTSTSFLFYHVRYLVYKKISITKVRRKVKRAPQWLVKASSSLLIFI